MVRISITISIANITIAVRGPTLCSQIHTRATHKQTTQEEHRGDIRSYCVIQSLHQKFHVTYEYCRVVEEGIKTRISLNSKKLEKWLVQDQHP